MSALTLAHIAKALGGTVDGDCVRAPGLGHSTKDRSLAIWLSSENPDGFTVHSHADDDPIASRDHVRKCLGLPAWKPGAARSSQAPANSNSRPRLGNAYIYRDKSGQPYLRVQRTEPKGAFLQSRWDGRAWVKGKPAGPKIPYRLPEILSAVHDAVFIVEGEKDADNLVDRGFVATTASEGAGKWKPELNRWFEGKDVFILADNDAPGEAHAQQVAENLYGVAREVRVVRLPGLPAKGDVTDWLEAGGDTGQLVDLCRSQTPWRPGEVVALDLQPPQPEPAGQRFTVEDFDTLAPSQGGDLVKGLWPSVGVCFVGGPSMSAKTFFVLEQIRRVVRGEPVLGRKSKAAGVLYIAAEAAEGVRKRILGLRQERGGLDGWFRFVGQAPNLLDKSDLRDLASLITAEQAAMESRGGRLGLVAIDTLSASIPGANENASEDMSPVLAALQDLAVTHRLMVLIVAHTGKDQDRGLRGWSGLLANADGLIMLEPANDDGTRSGSVVKVKDGLTGDRFGFSLRPVTIGQDEDGDDITTCVVESCEPPAPKAKRERRLTDEQKVVLKALDWCMEDGAELVPAGSRVAAGQLGVRRSALKDRAKEMGFGDDGRSEESQRRVLNRVIVQLAARGAARVEGDFVWPITAGQLRAA